MVFRTAQYRRVIAVFTQLFWVDVHAGPDFVRRFLTFVAVVIFGLEQRKTGHRCAAESVGLVVRLFALVPAGAYDFHIDSIGDVLHKNPFEGRAGVAQSSVFRDRVRAVLSRFVS
ncbi:hypothetical protein D3C86_1639770 [compost metagenome]